MSNDEFDVLVTLIERIAENVLAREDHPRDKPRQIALDREFQEAVEQARNSLVL